MINVLTFTDTQSRIFLERGMQSLDVFSRPNIGIIVPLSFKHKRQMPLVSEIINASLIVITSHLERQMKQTQDTNSQLTNTYRTSPP